MPEGSAVRAAGGVLWRRVDGVVEVALVHRPKYDDWSLPKGKLDPGEPAVLGALREVCEETGFQAVAGRTLGTSTYRVLQQGRDVPKTVQWWAMRAVGGDFVPGEEVDRLRWAPLSSALARVSAGYDCAPLRAFAAGPPETTTVLLVRHGAAGDPESWTGPDELRPLDETGRTQAEALADVLAAYAPTRIVSAPLLRCTQTVGPLATRLGLDVEQEVAASERENVGGPSPLVSLVRRAGAGGEAVVIASQGGAIPAAVAQLTGQQDVPARKGSRWALSFAAGALVDASYTARPQD